MLIVTVTFCGHSNICNEEETRKWLRDMIRLAIQNGAQTFLLGGYGAFDRIAAGVVQSLKAEYPHIQSILVLPYLDMTVDSIGYDGTTYPPLESVPKRYAIIHRNRWLVDNSDLVIAYVSHGWGGAATTLRYALKKKKEIINYDEAFDIGNAKNKNLPSIRR